MTKDKIKLVKTAIGLASVTALVAIAGTVYQASAATADTTSAQSQINAPAGSASGGIYFGGTNSDNINGGVTGNGQGYMGNQGQGNFASPQTGFSGRTRTSQS